MASFCSSGQTVASHSSIKFTYSNCISSGQIVNKDFYNKCIDALKKIHNYGTYGTRNPTQAQLNTLATMNSGTKVNAADYNKFITILSGTKANTGNVLLGSYPSNLINLINNYKLNSDRCNSCVSGCQSACQISAQCNGCCQWCNAEQYCSY